MQLNQIEKCFFIRVGGLTRHNLVKMQLLFTCLWCIAVDAVAVGLKMPCINYSWEFRCRILLSARPPTSWHKWSRPENLSTVFQEKDFFESVNHHSWLDVWYGLWLRKTFLRQQFKLRKETKFNSGKSQSMLGNMLRLNCDMRTLVQYTCF